MHSETISATISGWFVKLGSVMESRSMGPLPMRNSKTRRNGEMKSASTPSISSPTIIVAQSKQIGGNRQLSFLVSTEPNMLQKIFAYFKKWSRGERMEPQVLEQVDRQRIVELARDLADIVSITGDEKGVADYLGSEFEKLGMQVEYQRSEERRVGKECRDRRSREDYR